jgi:hypothetical protein
MVEAKFISHYLVALLNLTPLPSIFPFRLVLGVLVRIFTPRLEIMPKVVEFLDILSRAL